MKKHLTLILFSIIFGIYLILPRVGFALDIEVSIEGKNYTVGATFVDGKITSICGAFISETLSLILGLNLGECLASPSFSTYGIEILGDYEIMEELPVEAVRGSVGMGFVSADCEFKHDLRDYPEACCGYWEERPGKVSPICMMPPLTSKNWRGVLYVDAGKDYFKELAPCCLIDRILTIGDYIFFGLLVVAIIVILLAAWGFLTAAGEPDKVKKARNHLLYAVIGIAVAFLAKAGVKVIAAIVG